MLLEAVRNTGIKCSWSVYTVDFLPLCAVHVNIADIKLILHIKPL